MMSMLLSSKYVGLARTVYIYTVYDRIFVDFPAKNTVYTPYIYIYIYGSGQLYKYVVVAFAGRISFIYQGAHFA